MAVPTEARRQTEPRPPASDPDRQMRRLGAALGRPLFALALAIIAGSMVIFLTSPGGPDINTVFNAYQSLYTGAFGNLQTLSYTLIRVGALILTGISVALAFRVGLFNIGAEGQLAVGATVAGIIAFKLPTLPGYVLIPLMIIGSALAGAIWGGLVGFLKAWRGAHEVVTTIMLNWVAFYVADYFIDGPFKAPQQANQTPSIPLQATFPSIALFYNNTLGRFLPAIPEYEQYLVDVTFFFALLALVVYWFITRRTTFGYEIRVIGQNPGAARYAGISIGRNLIITMALAGAFAGLAGSFRLMGQFPYQLIGNTFASDPTGFDAIGVSLLGGNTAIGMLLAALLFGGLRQGSTQMQLNTGISGDLISIILALVLFCIAAEFLPAIRRSLPTWMPLSRKPALVGTPGTVIDIPPTQRTNDDGKSAALGDMKPPPEEQQGEER